MDFIKGKKISKMYACDNKREIHDIMNSQILTDGKTVDCVFIGDSITEFWEVAYYFGDLGMVVNRGIGGDVIYGVAKRFDVDVLQLKPKVCSLMVGVNDLGYIDSKAAELLSVYSDYDGIYPFTTEYIEKEMLPYYEEMMQKSKNADIELLVCSVMPAIPAVIPEKDYRNYFVIYLNKRLKEISKKYSFDYVDFHSQVKDEKNLMKKKLFLGRVTSAWTRLCSNGCRFTFLSQKQNKDID